ncbi:hypothetical protein [Kitasatospora sp. NPDC085879]|jgi:hypothetical protein|uniref:hypothetical protein n=1 Tax=Kitasatospora sp. NPDC085879 TaxID=3154769 RepID=UPI000BB0E25C|nr:hypothetical protein [Streptomyces sp. TLI_235]PBC66098.1 hypothetical protein BX265_8586 [Streptomyces sp. TLI_235]
MRQYVRTAVVAALLGASALTGPAAVAAGSTAYPEPSKQEHLYTVPVAGITDVGDLTKLGLLGYDFAGLLGH